MKIYSSLIAILLILISCAAPLKEKEFSLINGKSTIITIDSTISGDKAITTLIKPYRYKIDSVNNIFLVSSAINLNHKKPEGNLGQLIARILHETAQRHSRQKVDLAIMNHYGLRRSLSAGLITVGNIYELAPFDNEIVLIDLKGSDLYDLAGQIIKNNGEPISNFKIEYEDIDHLKIYISDKPVNPDSIYVAATLDYTYTSDNNLNVLRHGKNYRRLGILLRDSIINYLKQIGDNNKQLDFTKKSLIQKMETE